jgi:hypothetical protein
MEPRFDPMLIISKNKNKNVQARGGSISSVAGNVNVEKNEGNQALN